MKKRALLILVFIIILFPVMKSGYGLFKLAEPLLEKPYSPGYLIQAANPDEIFVLEVTAKRLDRISLVDGQLIKGPLLENTPTGLILADKDIVISSARGEGDISVIDSETLVVKSSFSAGFGARSPQFHPKQNYLSVCQTWSDDVGIYKLPEGTLVKTIPVLRQPYVSALSVDGRYLFVANFITHQRADRDTVATAISVIDMDKLVVHKDIMLANGSNALRGISLSSDGKYVLVSHNLGRFQVPTTQLEQGWMNTSAMSVIHVESLTYEGTVLLDEPEFGAAGSWGIDCADGFIAVAHSGTHDVSVIRENDFFTKLKTVAEREILSYDLNFLSGLRDRIKVPGNGPRNLKWTKQGLAVGMYFSDTINLIQEAKPKEIVRSFALNQGFTESQARLGEKYFNDADYCFQGWQSCNGCHPMDGRTDGLNWDLLNDGIGNPRNCKSMLLAIETPPAMITGIRPDAQTAVRAGFRHIQFAQVPEERTQAVDAYLSSLVPVPSPFLVSGSLSEKAQEGKKIYEELGCDYCHPGPYYTDMRTHAFTSENDTLGPQRWDTPTLCEVWRTGPWLHDGRAAKMHEVFSVEKHGISEALTKDQIDRLVEYVMSL